MTSKSTTRLISAGMIIAAMVSLPGPARSATITNLADQNLQAYYGRYAPRGDCSKGPILTIDASGFGYEIAGKTSHSTRIETAYSFFGNSYQGISFAFFPFARSDDDYGATTMVLNDDEVPGKITFSNDGPQPLTSVQQALAKASPWLCQDNLFRMSEGPRLNSHTAAVAASHSSIAADRKIRIVFREIR